MPDPHSPQKSSYRLEVEPGRYKWCACGLSQTQPFCDGSHRGTEFSPVITEITEKKTVSWCGCKFSANKPFCDGTHKSL